MSKDGQASHTGWSMACGAYASAVDGVCLFALELGDATAPSAATPHTSDATSFILQSCCARTLCARATAAKSYNAADRPR